MIPATVSANGYRYPSLLPDDVFVFGARTEGWHGLADAGWAFKGTVTADWATNELYREAIGSKVGLRAVWGVARGLQTGTAGKGYAIEAAVDWAMGAPALTGEERYAAKRSVDEQLRAFLEVARTSPTVRFVVGPVGLTPEFGGAGLFTAAEMTTLWHSVLRSGPALNVHIAGVPRVRQRKVPSVEIATSTPDQSGGVHVRLVDYSESAIEAHIPPDHVLLTESTVALASSVRAWRHQLHRAARDDRAADHAILRAIIAQAAHGPVTLCTIGGKGNDSARNLCEALQNFSVGVDADDLVAL